MINWSVVAPALRTLLSDLALAQPVTPAFEGRWSERQAEFIHPDVQKELILRVTSVLDFHTSRKHREVTITPEEGEPYTELEEVLVGSREFNLEVRVESHEHDEAFGGWALSMLERVRTGLLFQRAIDALLAVNVGLVRIGPSRDASFTFDKHRVNAAFFEATFNGAFCLADPVHVGWFERVAITSRLMNPAGVLLPSPPNVTGLVIPPLPAPEDEEPEPSP